MSIALFALILVLALLSYALIGYLWRSSPMGKVRIRGPASQLHIGEAGVRRAFEVLSGASLSSGNRIELLLNGDQLFPRLFDDLRNAQTLITWQVFFFKPGELADQVAEALCERARAGVKVVVLLDYFGSLSLGKKYVEDLRACDVEVQIYRRPGWRTFYKTPHRSHVRSVVIDGRVGYTGGFGIDDRWRGDGRSPGQWRDTHVRIEGPALDELQAPFIANWAEVTGELLFGEGIMCAIPVEEGTVDAAAVMFGSPSLGSTHAERFLALTISAAHSRLWITNAYFVPPRGFCRLLRQAAERGVDVRVLTPGENTDHRAAWYAGRACYEKLLRAGVRIFEYAPTMVHAKTLVADGRWVAVGSINFDNRSLKLNDEVTLVAEDAAFGTQMEEVFRRDVNCAQEVDLAQFQQRSWWEKTKEWSTAVVVGPIL